MTLLTSLAIKGGKKEGRYPGGAKKGGFLGPDSLKGESREKGERGST